jgi:hypothetical protein
MVGEVIFIDIIIIQAFDSAYGDAVETRFLGIMTTGHRPPAAIAAASGQIFGTDCCYLRQHFGLRRHFRNLVIAAPLSKVT